MTNQARDLATLEALESHLDQEYLLDLLIRLIPVRTEVPLGPDTLMEPDDPKLVHYVQEVIRPELVAMGAYELIEVPLNQLIVRVGQGSPAGRCLLVMAYTPTQHHNLMAEPFRPRIALGTAHGRDEPLVFGQGVSQNKVHMAAMLTVLRAIRSAQHELQGRLYFAINNEGRSSHACSDAILDALPDRPDGGLVLVGTNMDISVGNRGRVDVHVLVKGKATHSSAPTRGHSAIEGAHKVMHRVADNWHWPGQHPQLGSRHVVPYQVTYWPVAPHTLPEQARIIFDCRLLPGDDPAQAVSLIKAAIGSLPPYAIEVAQGVHMLPSLVDPQTELVRELAQANLAVRGAEPDLLYGQGSFDAGGPCARGVPTVMWGAGGDAELLRDDYVSVADAWAETKVLAKLIASWLR